MSIRGPSPPRILQIHSLHQVALGTLSHVPLRRRGQNGDTIFSGKNNSKGQIARKLVEKLALFEKFRSSGEEEARLG